MGLLQAVGLQGVSWGRALQASGCGCLPHWLLVAHDLVLPMLGRFSLLEGTLAKLYSGKVVLVLEGVAADGKATASSRACTSQKQQ